MAPTTALPTTLSTIAVAVVSAVDQARASIAAVRTRYVAGVLAVLLDRPARMNNVLRLGAYSDLYGSLSCSRRADSTTVER
jgi:hypothetical protein